MEKSTAAQVRKLQVIWREYAAASRPAQPDGGDDRADRLAWMSDKLGRRIESFKELTKGEAIRVIDTIERLLGKPRAATRLRQGFGGQARRPDEATAWAYGNEGKKKKFQAIAISPIDDVTLATMERLRVAVGWSSEQLRAFVRGRKGPGELATTAQGNRVIWVLRSILRRATKHAGGPPPRRVTAPTETVPTEAHTA